MATVAIYYFFYSRLMKLMHRFNWHYAPPRYPDGDTVLWCQWCGFRAVVSRRSGRELAIRHEAGDSPTKPQACDLCSRLASRVEELEQVLRSLYEITMALEKSVVWEIAPSILEYMKTTNRSVERVLAGARAEEKK